MKKRIVAVICVAVAAALACGLVACGGSSSKKESTSSSTSSASTAASTSYVSEATGEYASGTHHAKVTVKGYDAFTIELDADNAPVTVANFCKLANDGFYDGLTFHRIVEGFCLQGGDPAGNGTGGSDEEILGEFSLNGVNNKLADNFKEGVVAMARSSLPNSASSQFFITLDTSEGVSQSLDGQYAAFGTIDKAGMKIVQKIVKDYAKYADDSMGSISDASKQPIITSIKIVD